MVSKRVRNGLIPGKLHCKVSLDFGSVTCQSRSSPTVSYRAKRRRLDASDEDSTSVDVSRGAVISAPSPSNEDLDAVLTRIEKDQHHRQGNPSAWIIDGWDAEDEALWLSSKHWDMMKEMGIEPTGEKPSMKRRWPRCQPVARTSATHHPVKARDSQSERHSTLPLMHRTSSQSKPTTRTAQPFPMNLDDSDTEADHASASYPLPPTPTVQIIVNPVAGWKPRSLEDVIAEAKARKMNEQDDDGWDSEDEVLCVRQEQWRMMRALGIETQESEPSGYSYQRGDLVNLWYSSSQPYLARRWRPRLRVPPPQSVSRRHIISTKAPKRTPAPFPLNLEESEDTTSLPNTLPPIPDVQVIVNPDAEWKPRSLEVAIAEGKKRKLEEHNDDGWDSEDELLCIRREQWRMMRALGIETQETEPTRRWRPSGKISQSATSSSQNAVVREEPPQPALAHFPLDLDDTDVKRAECDDDGWDSEGEVLCMLLE